MSKRLLREALFLLLLALIACGAPALPPAAPPPMVVAIAASPAPPQAQVVAEGAREVEEVGQNLGPIPVTSADPQRGDRTALVTIVEFSDFQCPFCARIADTFAALRKIYRPDEVRLVWKNSPLAFHKEAVPAARRAIALFERGGSAAFWAYHDKVFANQGMPGIYVDAAHASGLSEGEIEAQMALGAGVRKIDEDVALAKQLGVNGTPASFVNGVFLSGAQPVEKFREVVDEQLRVARALVATGVPANRVHAQLAAVNYTKPPPPAATEPPDTAIHAVPIAGSPVRGKTTALVTLVMFSDYQCPFCGKVWPTVKQLESEYGDKLRIVYKHNPLPFHPRAEPAAELAIEARAQKGDAAFWSMNDALYAQQLRLSDVDLEDLAKAQGLDATKATAAVSGHKHKAKIDADVDLADDLAASGTPHFFVNGRRIVGAQPVEKFREIIDTQLVVAQALVQKGTAAAKVYDAILKTAVANAPFEHKNVAAPTKDNPSRGPASATIVVQMFSDFQCPFCKRAMPEIEALEKTFSGKVRLVWRNRPLPMHPDADPAAEAAMEAFAQQGATGFWKMVDALFAAQGTAGALKRPGLDAIAQQVGLDMARFDAALDTSAHKVLIDADSAAADAAKIDGTPVFVINGISISGAQPVRKFEKVVRHLLGGGK